MYETFFFENLKVDLISFILLLNMILIKNCPVNVFISETSCPWISLGAHEHHVISTVVAAAQCISLCSLSS